MVTLILQASAVGFFMLTFCLVCVLTTVENFMSEIWSLGYSTHFPNRFIRRGSDPSILHLTLLNLISASITSGWNVIQKKMSSCAGRNPLVGVIVKYFLQKVVSHSNLAPISPRLDSWRDFVFLEYFVTTPNPIVSSISFSSMPWHDPIILSNFLYSQLSIILYASSFLKL